jgi:vitamin B12 transporter
MVADMPPIRFPKPALAGALLLAAAPASAQVVDLGRITVFSYGLTPVEAQSTGANVTVVTEAELAAAGDVQLSSFLGRLPGVSVVQTGPVGTVSDVRIRGAHPRYTVVYIDGVRVNDPASANAAFAFGTLTTADIGRVEILRGSQSARFGSAAVGGVINITTRGATEPGTSQRVFMEAGSYRTLNLGYGFAQASERGELAFNASRLQTRGFSAADEAEGATEPDGFRATRLSFSGRHRVTDALTLGVSAFAQRSRGEYDGFGFNPVLGDFGPVDADNVERRREFGGRVFAEYELGVHRHVFDLTGYRLNRQDDFVNFMDVPQIDDFRGRRLGASYIGSSPVGDALTLNYGVDFERERVRIERDDGAVSEIAVSERRRGIYGEALFRPTEALDLSAILRHDRHSVFGGRTTGRAGIAWHAAPGLTLRAAASTGYRVPSIPERFGAFGNPALEPEESRSAEIGADYAFGTGARLSGTLFHLEARNEITFNPVSFVSENLERTRRRGLELEFATPLGARSEIGAAYTYTDAVITAGPDAGLRIGRVPRHDLALTASTEFAPRWHAQGVLHYVADRLDRTGAMPMPSYTVVNARVSYAVTERADLFLRVDNLFDRQYQTVAGFGTPGRSYYAGVAARF